MTSPCRGCDLLDIADCLAQGGTFEGTADCLLPACSLSAPGACCLSGGGCLITDPADCSACGGTFVGGPCPGPC